MARRNHSRRAYAPYGNPEAGYAEDFGGRPEYGQHEEGGWQGRWEDVNRMVTDRPHTSLFAAFGVGFGLGLVVTLLLSRQEESWFERYAPEAIQDLPDRLHHARHRLSDSMSGTLKQAGETLASHVPSSWRRW